MRIYDNYPGPGIKTRNIMPLPNTKVDETYSEQLMGWPDDHAHPVIDLAFGGIAFWTGCNKKHSEEFVNDCPSII